MILGVLKDIKHGENRVMLTPLEVSTILENGHKVYVQTGCGEAAGFADQAYQKAGAELRNSAEEIYGQCDFVVKVKEIEESEYELLREGQIVYCCIHPAAHAAEV